MRARSARFNNAAVRSKQRYAGPRPLCARRRSRVARPAPPGRAHGTARGPASARHASPATRRRPRAEWRRRAQIANQPIGSCRSPSSCTHPGRTLSVAAVRESQHNVGFCCGHSIRCGRAAAASITWPSAASFVMRRPRPGRESGPSGWPIEFAADARRSAHTDHPRERLGTRACRVWCVAKYRELRELGPFRIT